MFTMNRDGSRRWCGWWCRNELLCYFFIDTAGGQSFFFFAATN